MTFDFPIPQLRRVGALSPMHGKAQVVNTKDRRRLSSSWRASSPWECPCDNLGHRPVMRTVRSLVKPVTEMAHLHRSIRKMEAASAKIMLERLQEEWLEVADASIYKDLELEKQLWLLSALRSIQGLGPLPRRNLRAGAGAGAEVRGASIATRCLSLYENHGSSFMELTADPEY